MARTVLPIVGALVGGYFGGPTGAQLGWAAGAAIGGAVDPVINKGPAIGDLQSQTAQEGAFRTVVYGTYPVYGNVLCTGPGIKSVEIESGEGKGGPKNETEHVYRNFAIRICEAIPGGAILRVWEFDKLVYDVRPGSLMLAESNKWKSNKAFYMGGEDQLPDIYLELNVSGVGETPAYRDSCYMVVGLEDQTDTRGAIAQYRFEVSSGATTILLEKIPSISGGGYAGNGDISGMFFSDDTAVPELYTAPLMLMKCTGPPVGSSFFRAPSKFIAWLSDDPLTRIADSGWLGDPAYQSNLDAALASYGYEGEIGPIVGSESDTEIHGLPPGSTVIFQQISCQLPFVTEGDRTAAGIYFSVPDPDELTPGWVYYGTPGVLLTVEGDPFAASWGPDFINSAGGPVGLDEIVSDIHTRCRMTANQYDVTELNDEVTGFGLAGDFTGGSAIAVLQGPYKFDKSSHDGKLWYPKRGGSVLRTFTVDDLVELPDTARREETIEYPAKLHLFYQHAASGYAVVKATSTRSSPNVLSVGEISLQVPIVLNEDQAAQMAAIQHKIAWVEAGGEVQYSVPESFLKYTPADVLALSIRGRVERLRLNATNHADGVIGYTLTRDRQSAYTSDLTGVPIPPPNLPPSTIVGETILAVMDVPSRQDTEDDLNILYAVTGGLPAWYGAAVQRSTDGGADFSTVANIDTASVMGTILEDVPAMPSHLTDLTSTVKVQLFRDGQVIEDISEVQFLSEDGAFALRNSDGSWEILQYRDVSQDSTGSFILSTLHRGLLNSGASAHSAGALFVLMRSPTHITMPSSLIGQTLVHRAVSYSESAETAAEQTDVYLGRSQIEWPVAYLKLTKSGNIVSGRWTPRMRFGTEVNPISSINFQGYRVTITGSSTVTFDTISPNFSYDVSALGGTVTVAVSAINRITGAGPSTSGSI